MTSFRRYPGLQNQQLDRAENENRDLVPGAWREGHHLEDTQTGPNTASKDGKKQRNLLKHWVNSPAGAQNGVGMNEPLVDAEDYPRSDIDVYRVRNARRDIICLQNDHKVIMGEIEQGLHILHSNDNPETYQRGPQVYSNPHTMPRPFASVDTVTAGSPAHTAGLKPGDGIVGFGSVTLENFQGLQNISFVVQHSEGKGVNVRVLRDENLLGLTVVPQKWNGRGLLGYVFSPTSEKISI
uniref:26S proteasome non-ATPase regulatory subunit 9 isoform X2 n=1 Tax=Myxine glutinosa TaxID=7769 RepID=UPI00358EBC9B